ncbi:RES family NAD+ phosphorylase [Pseudomonas lundensis]|uniref:RES family NAD+ phosphorylase n=1 Tax=Pseudomonas lundensis TaxID=86185 RepID=UPI004045C30B
MDEDLICHQCLNEAYLIGLIRRTGETAKCSFCLKKRKAIPFEDLISMVDDVLQKYCHPGAIYDQYDDNGKRSETEQTGDSLIVHVAELLDLDEDDPVVERVLGDLSESSHYDIMQGGEGRYSDDQNYEWRVIRPREAEARWLNFQNEMKHGNRFFSQHAKGFLDWLFRGVSSFKSPDGSMSVVRELVDDQIFRARRCDSASEYDSIISKPAAELGPPPREVAGAGRMNPKGLAAFYGAFDRKTCVAELRPPVGGRVVSGEFKLTRPVRVLDFIALDEAYETRPLSAFEASYEEQMGRRIFLKTLHAKITVPVLPNQEHEYLATQVMAEYLATQFEPPLDGVLFKSAQVRIGTNLTLFNHAVVASLEPGTAFANLDELLSSPPTQTPAVEYVPDTLVRHKVCRVRFITDDLARDDGQPESDEQYDDWDEY